MNPVDEYLEARDGKEKTAVSAGRFFDPTRPSGLIGHGALFLGAHVLGRAAAKTYRAITKTRDFNRMLEHNPDLEDERQNLGEKRFNQLYSSFRAMNPEFAAEPIVAGTYMRTMTMSPETAGKAIVESLQHRPPSMTVKDISTGMGLARGVVAPPAPNPEEIEHERILREEKERKARALADQAEARAAAQWAQVP